MIYSTDWTNVFLVRRGPLHSKYDKIYNNDKMQYDISTYRVFQVW